MRRCQFIKAAFICIALLLFLLFISTSVIAQTPIPNATVDGCFVEDYPDPITSEYILPFQTGESYVVSQGNCGRYITHRPVCTGITPSGNTVSCGDLRYSYDFFMPPGTMLIAARAGTVTFVFDDFSNDSNVFGEENYIAILHSDGTGASYLHNSPNTALVSVGDQVVQGQPIVQSGSSGFTDPGFFNPHLHFVLFTPPFVDCDETIVSGCKSAPVVFRNAYPLDAPLIEDKSYTALSPNLSLGSSILPPGRSVQVGQPATALASLANASGTETATGCGIVPITKVPGNFVYQTTDPATNLLVGTINTPVDIPPNGVQSFFLGFDPVSAALPPTDVAFNFSCKNGVAAPVFTAFNTFLLSASVSPIADIVALTTGIVDIQATVGVDGLFGVVSSNVGAADGITVNVDAGNLPVALSVCETDQNTGACKDINNVAPSVTFNYAANSAASFAVFYTANAVIPFDTVNNRVFVRFTDSGGVVRGITSVSLSTL